MARAPLLARRRRSLSITEFMADNTKTLGTRVHAYSDWIEIHNAGPGTATLDGWYLTDNASNLNEWRFPTVPGHPVTLADGGYMVVFASNKDRRADSVTGLPVSEFHTNFKLDASGEYLALVQPDGQTIATQFAPKFPKQYSDVSYGLSQDFSSRGSLTPPTPGQALLPGQDPSSSLIVINEIMYHPGYGGTGLHGLRPRKHRRGIRRALQPHHRLDQPQGLGVGSLVVCHRPDQGRRPGDRRRQHGHRHARRARLRQRRFGRDHRRRPAPVRRRLHDLRRHRQHVQLHGFRDAPLPGHRHDHRPARLRQVKTLTHDDYTATVYLPGHGFHEGDSILISGADQDAYNGVFTISGVTADSFSYALPDIPTGAGHRHGARPRGLAEVPRRVDSRLGLPGHRRRRPDLPDKYPTVTNVVAAWTPKLSDTGETVQLRNAQGSSVSKVTYADEGDWAAHPRRRAGHQHHAHAAASPRSLCPTTVSSTATWSASPAPATPSSMASSPSPTPRATPSPIRSPPALGLRRGNAAAELRDNNHYGWQWYQPADGQGKSLELINPAMAVNEGENSGPSTVDGGTPGTANSIASSNIAPLVTDVTPSPAIPRSTDPVTVTARVTDEVSAGVSANLLYRVDSRAADGIGIENYVTSPKSIATLTALAKGATITRSGSTATVTCNGHGYVNGDLVTIGGATQPEYNGIFTIANVTINTSTYAVSGTPASPATGSLRRSRPPRSPAAARPPR